jgi:hypothetical protein
MRSTVIVPVTADSGPVAVLIVSADQPDVFTERDVATLELLAVVLARRARPGRRAVGAQARRRRPARAQRPARGVIDAQRAIDAAGLDLEAVMELIVERAMELTRADGAMVSLIDGDDLVVAASRGVATKMAAAARSPPRSRASRSPSAARC